MTNITRISVAYGDGIGPEIMEATLQILKNAGAQIQIDTIEIGERLYLKGNTTGISESAWESVMKNKILLKAPITTPQGKGYKSLNVTFRKTLGLFANVRPVMTYHPFVDSVQEKMDMVIFRENEEDLYAGVEYMPTENYALSYKLITRQNCEKISRYAFEYARQNGRKKVTALVKDNIMKIADGMFHETFDEVAKDYPDIKAESMIVDIGSARIASRPQDFDLIVTLNLYGDIVSDIAAEVSGSVGLAGSANVGAQYAMFEAVHGSAPDIAGKGIANPSGLLNGAIMMLEHIGQQEVAAKIKNAWLKTIEDGIHTGDIYKEGVSKKKVGTKEFADAVIANLGELPSKLPAIIVKKGGGQININLSANKEFTRKMIGFDVYLNAPRKSVGEIANQINSAVGELAKLHLISQKGLKLWPNMVDGLEVDEFLGCRFIGYADTGLDQRMINRVLDAISDAGFVVSSVQNLFAYNDKNGFTMAQGE